MFNLARFFRRFFGWRTAVLGTVLPPPDRRAKRDVYDEFHEAR
jgi:hypothetical protein